MSTAIRDIGERKLEEERVTVERSEPTEAKALLAQNERDLVGRKDEWRPTLVQAGLPARLNAAALGTLS